MLPGQQGVQAHWKEHFPYYVFISAIFLTGVVFGAVLVDALTLDMSQDISRHLSNFFLTVDDGRDIDPERSFWRIFSLNIKWIVLIWLLGMSVVGLPVILALNFLKGALIGFSVAFLAQQYAWKGLLFALVSIVPQNVVLIPAILVCSVAGMAFSVCLVRNRFIQKKGAVYPPFVRYCLLTLAIAVMVAGISLFEAYVSPELMRSVTPMITALP